MKRLIAAIVLIVSAPIANPTWAATILEQPYDISVRLYNVGSELAFISWEGSTVDFQSLKPSGELSGVINWVANGSPWKTEAFGGNLDSSGAFSFGTLFPTVPTLFSGTFSPDSLFASGRLDGLGSSDMTGFWAMDQIPVNLPSSLFLMSTAICGLVLVSTRKPQK